MIIFQREHSQNEHIDKVIFDWPPTFIFQFTDYELTERFSFPAISGEK